MFWLNAEPGTDDERSCTNDNETSSTVKTRNYLDKLRDNWLLKLCYIELVYVAS
jgi:hypothetical protein